MYTKEVLVARGYTRFSTHNVEEILPHLGYGKPKLKLGNHTVNTSTNRLVTYTKGITCVKCKLKAEFFAVEDNHSGAHLNLYGIKDGKEVMMTSDHIVPKSQGGTEGLKNRQCMCEECNLEKRDTMPESGGVRNIGKARRLEKQRQINKIRGRILSVKQSKMRTPENKKKVIELFEKQIRDLISTPLREFDVNHGNT